MTYSELVSRCKEILFSITEGAERFFEWCFTPITFTIGDNSYSVESPIIWLFGTAFVLFLVIRLIKVFI